jgi:L-alanine-DL-glutamate epimerase-like enolase superfamily enzyme
VWKVGGITEWMKIAAIAQAGNLVVSPHGALELSAHLAAAIPNSDRIEHILGMTLYAFGATTVEPRIVDGAMRPVDEPGLSVLLDGPALERYKVA